MTDNSESPGRRSIRLRGYDYTRPGAYFITICTHNREQLFGRITDGRMHLNRVGEIVQSVWRESGVHFPATRFDVFVVMPDHFHGIVIIGDDWTGSGYRRGTACRAPTTTACRAPTTTACRAPDRNRAPDGIRAPAFGQPIAGSIPTIVGAFKSAVTKRINDLRATPGARVWQRNYYERILPNQEALRRTQIYILNNPANR